MKISPLPIYLTGLFSTLAVVSFGYFQFYMPNMKEVDLNNDTLTALQTEAGKLPQAKKRVADAVDKVNKATAAWQKIVSTRTPPSNVAQGGIDLSKDAWHLAIDIKTYRNNVQRLVNKQMLAGGVKVVTGPYVPGVAETEQASSLLASYFHFPEYPYPVVIYDLGQVTVQGTYKQITDHVRSWSRLPRYLALADGLSITGTSPNLTGTYNLQVLGYIRGKNIAPPVKEAAASGGAGGGFGGGGFGGGGFGGPGGPPPGFGGPPSLSGASSAGAAAPRGRGPASGGD